MELGLEGEGAEGAYGPRPSVARSIGLTTVATGLVYATTLLQQALYGRALGVNADTDVLATGLAWGVATTGLVGTTLTSVLLPAFVRAIHAGETHRQSVLRNGWALALAVAAMLMVATFVGAGVLADALGPGLPPGDREHLADVLRLTSPLQLIWIASWMGVSIANASERYVLAAASAILPPLPVVAMFALSRPRVDDVALAYVVGAALQLVVLGIAGRRAFAGVAGAPDLRALRPLVRRLAMVGAAFAMMGAIPIVVRAIASQGRAGDVAVADYASRLALAGEQLVLSGLLAVIFTRWSTKHPDLPVATTIARVLGVVVAVGVALPILAQDLIAILLGGGRFTGEDVDTVATFLSWMAPGVASHMLLMVVARALLAQARLAAFGAASAVALIVFGVVAVAGHSAWGLQGVAVAYSLGWLSGVSVAIVGLHVASVPLLAELARSATTAGAAGLATWVVLQNLPDAPILRVAAGGFAFTICALAIGRALGVSAVRYIASRLARSTA